MLIGGFSSPRKQLLLEIDLRKEQGYQMTPAAESALAAVLADPTSNEVLFNAVYAELDKLPKDPTFFWIEPNELDEIRQARPKNAPTVPPMTLSDEQLLDCLHGAWIGRSVGCALGKPVEGMGMKGKRFRDIQTYLEERGDWPLKDYFSNRDVGGTLKLECPLSQRENIRFMETDDDIRYPLLAMLILERFGKNFTSENVASLWDEVLPMRYVCSAECQALLNYNLIIPPLQEWSWRPFDKEFIRSWNNPYREWIGAQIRADFFGFISPGKPEQAAEFAWRDASWTHEKNGIYGEMFIAALESVAFLENNPVKLIEFALAQIPEKCRLADGIQETLKKVKPGMEVTEFMEWLEERLPTMNAVHTINNAMICVAALVAGEMNPDRCVCWAVSCGLDTDCNGATVGTITGLATGAKNFGGTLAARLNDTICANFTEFREVSMTDLAKRTLNVYHQIND